MQKTTKFIGKATKFTCKSMMIYEVGQWRDKVEAWIQIKLLLYMMVCLLYPPFIGADKPLSPINQQISSAIESLQNLCENK